MSGERLRVLHLIDQLSLGGAERFTMDVVKRLDGDLLERTLCATRAPGAFWSPDRRAAAMAELEAAGVRVLQLSRTGTLDVRPWAPLVRLLRRERIQILHAHMFTSSVWGTVLARTLGVPVVVAHEHGSPTALPLSRRVLERRLLGRFADAYLAVSEPERRRLVERGIPAARTHVLPNGIVTPTVDPSRDVRAELGLAPGAPVIGTVGVLREEKGIDVLLRAAARVRERHPDLRVVVIGDGVMREDLERLAGELGLGEAVLFTGVRLDVPDVLRALDVAVNSSHREGSPLSVMEYMEAALPVAATAVGGVPEIVRDGEEGLLVPPADPEALAGAISSLLDDPERARAMGERGRGRRRTAYDLDGTARRLEELYARLWAQR